MRCPAGFRSGTNPVYHVHFPSSRYSKTCWHELSSLCRRHSTLCCLQARNNRSGLLSTDSGLLGSDAGLDMNSKFLKLNNDKTDVILIGSRHQHSLFEMEHILPYFGKRKQVTYHPNLSYRCFHNSHNELFFQAKFHAETLILLRDM